MNYEECEAIIRTEFSEHILQGNPDAKRPWLFLYPIEKQIHIGDRRPPELETAMFTVSRLLPQHFEPFGSTFYKVSAYELFAALLRQYLPRSIHETTNHS